MKSFSPKELPGKGKRILFANVPADGHFNPLTGLAVHLKQLGYEIAWYSSTTYGPKINKLGFRHYPFVKALELTSQTLSELHPERDRISGQIAKLNFDLIHFFIKRGEEYFLDIKNIHEEFPFDLLIADSAFTGTVFVKEKMNIPVLSIGIIPLVETSRDLPPAMLGLTPARTWAGRQVHRMMRFAADRILFRKASGVARDLLYQYGIEWEGSNVFDMVVKKSDIFLQSGTPSFEYRRSDLGSNIRFAGPLLPYMSHDAQPGWFDPRLNQYAQVVLVTQGTVEKDIEKLLVPTLEAFRNSNILVVATTGGNGTEELRSRFSQHNMIIEDFIPFTDIMPYADVYVTNGGYGGVLLGIEHGLPLLVAGVHEGKNEINARVGYFRIGINLKTELPGSRQIRDGVEKLLSDLSYKENAFRLSAEFGQYNPNAICAEAVAELLAGPVVRPVPAELAA